MVKPGAIGSLLAGSCARADQLPVRKLSDLAGQPPNGFIGATIVDENKFPVGECNPAAAAVSAGSGRSIPSSSFQSGMMTETNAGLVALKPGDESKTWMLGRNATKIMRQWDSAEVAGKRRLFHQIVRNLEGDDFGHRFV